MYKYFVYFLLVAISIGCVKKYKNDAFNCQSNKPTERTKIQIKQIAEYTCNVSKGDDYEYTPGEKTFFRKDSVLYYAGYSLFQQYIDVYNLATSERILKTKWSYDGPSGIKNAGTVYFLDFDSIFVIDAHRWLVLIDSSGQVHKKWDITYSDGDDKYIALASMYNNFIMLFDSKNQDFYLYLDLESMDFGAAYVKKIIGVFNLTDGKYHRIIGNYPEPYKSLAQEDKKLRKFLYPSYCMADSSLYVSCPQIPEIQKYNKFSGVFEENICAKSRFIDHNFLITNIDDHSKDLDCHKREQSYTTLKFDPVNRLFYRIVKHSQEYSDTSKINWQAPWSLIIINDKFQILDEIKFEAYQYNFDTFSVFEGGFFLRKIEDAEDHITFCYFKPEIQQVD